MANKAFKYRIYPNFDQATKIKKNIGCARLVYNLLLEDYKHQLDERAANKELNVKLKEVSSFKQNPEYDFLKESDSLGLANSKLHIQQALKNFFDSRTGKRKGNKVCFPKKHKKSKSKLSYTTNNQNGTVEIKDNKIKLPKIGWIKLEYHREHIGTIKSVTVTQERDNTFYVSVLCEYDSTDVKLKYLNKNNPNVVGLDMSYDKFVVDSDDSKSDDTKPKYVRQYRVNEKKIKKLNRQLSRKAEGSSNRAKARMKLAKFHRHVANCRLDFAHKTSLYYAKNYDVVVIEDIDMQNQAKSNLKGHGKSVNDLGFGLFKSFLDYKCIKYGTLLVKADKWFASSKICNHCGEKNPDLAIGEMEWVCPHCGCVIDRDKNAAYNLRDYFYKTYNTAGTAGIHACGDSASTLDSLESFANGVVETGSLAKPLA